MPSLFTHSRPGHSCCRRSGKTATQRARDTEPSPGDPIDASARRSHLAWMGRHTEASAGRTDRVQAIRSAGLALRQLQSPEPRPTAVNRKQPCTRSSIWCLSGRIRLPALSRPFSFRESYCPPFTLPPSARYGSKSTLGDSVNVALELRVSTLLPGPGW